MERILGLDIGSHTIGIAYSDPLGIMAQNLKTIKRRDIEEDIDELLEIIRELGVQTIVVGLPKNMNNTEGPSCQMVYDFTEKLKNIIDIEIIYQDERLTTVAAEKMLIGIDKSRKDRKKVIDQIAATFILQNYLDRRN